MRIPFDNLCVAASVHGLQNWIGAKAQRWVQVTPRTLALQLYWQRPGWLWISWDQEFGRVVLGPPPQSSIELSPFATELKKRLGGDRLCSVKQFGRDRILRLTFQSGQALIVEVMGRHANAILLEGERQVAAAKWLGPAQSTRPVLPGRNYERLPESGEFSPFLRRFPDAIAVAEKFFSSPLESAFQSREGIYPIALGLPEEVPVSNFGEAKGANMAAQENHRAFEQLRSALHSQLIRVSTARREAISSLRDAAESAARASEYQMLGELTLAYGFQAPAGSMQLEVLDYQGAPLFIPYDYGLTAPENAERWFRKAKRAKEGIDEVREQLARQTSDFEDVEALLATLPNVASLDELEKSRLYAEGRRWLHRSGAPQPKEDRPFAGHRIRELQGPRGFIIFYGENAEANDYLTMRMGKPNDIWMHVRGHTSAHVLIPSQNQPERVPMDVLKFGAEVSARHSSLKHSNLVPVDYTLKKYVRRPKGASKGFVTYTHEKTLHVSPVSSSR